MRYIVLVKTAERHETRKAKDFSIPSLMSKIHAENPDVHEGKEGRMGDSTAISLVQTRGGRAIAWVRYHTEPRN
jgi:hypothetical protein